MRDIEVHKMRKSERGGREDVLRSALFVFHSFCLL